MSGPATRPDRTLSAAEKREMLARLLAEKAARPRRLPLSFAQLRLWFLDRMAPGTDAYNVWTSSRLPGPLDLSAFAASLREIVRRHATLRTTFVEGDGEAVQVVAATGEPALLAIDLGGLPAGRRDDEARRLAAVSARTPFDLSMGPLLRTFLLRIDGEESLAVAVMHHIVSDAWSMHVLIRELKALYEAFSAGRPSPLPPLPIQYTDFAQWQRQHLRDEVLEEQIAYWKERLRDTPVLEMPTDRPRPPVQSFRGAARPFAFGAGLRDALMAIGQREGATPFMVLLAALQALLHRYTGQEEICVGTPVSNRERTELQGLIGFFVNTLVLRVSLAGAPGFRELLGRVREAALGAYAHQDLPFEKLVEELQPRRDVSRSVLFQVAFALQNVPDTAGPAEAASPTAIERETVKFELNFEASEGPWGISGLAEYNRDLFDHPTIQRLLEHLGYLLEGVVAAPATPIGDLLLMSPAQHQQLLHEWNDPAEAGWASLRLHELIEQQALRTPGSVAVSFGGGALTYRELNEQANRLAHRLHRLGVGPEVRVAVCLDRSLDLVVGLLAVLKAGGAYLPLDPEYPPARTGFMLEDSRATVLLTQEKLLAGLPPHAAQTVRVDADRSAIEAESGADPEPRGWPESLAYMIYTSGSTGRPKGVQIPHAALVNFLASMRQRPGLGSADAVLAVTSISFDIAALELYLPLAVGARVVLASREEVQDGPLLQGLLARSGATVMQSTPATWRLLVASGWEGDPDLKVLCGGESLTESLAAELLARSREVWNLYGPTETTVWSTIRKIAPDQPVSVGRPIARTQAHVIDAGGALAPVGTPGELLLGGAGVARGYLGGPDLTAERFVPDAFGGRSGGRLYRTGDLARFRPDGGLEILGRLDHQVKIRGFRIELGEVEAALARHPDVAQAVVIARPDRDGARLIGYVVPAAGKSPEPAELRGFLQASLTPYMVPAVFVTLDSLPLTPNRKVDRKALPDPSPRTVAKHVAPRSPVEETLAAIWREALGLERVGVEDNFFDLGGHSLRLVEVQTRVRERLGRELSIVELFRHPTIGSLADHLEPRAARGPKAAPPKAAVRPFPAGSDLAIIGMTCRFPEAPDVERFWRNLREGRESILRLADEDLLAAGLPPSRLDQPGYVRAEPVLAGIDLFDAAFFGFNPREAEALDPQQRLFLESAWECLEEAGYDPARYPGKIGVFAGARWPGYAANLLSNPEILDTLDGLTIQTSVDKDYLATRVSYKLNLRGPSLSVQTACSTSLVAAHLARRAILAGDCEMALIGGVSLQVPQARGYLYQEGGIYSPDGHCRAFDAQGKGTLFGSGVGIVLLKRLDEALRDGDHIHAVLKSTAVNNDGALKVGYTAPSVEGQSEVIAAAQAEAGIHPDSIGCIEGHGTATPLGDPVEVAALTQAFRRRGAAGTCFCALGSVKTNIGHLDTAAGMAGMIKAVLALKHRQIPPSLHFEEPNPRIDFAASPFYVNTRLRDWPDGEAPRRAGVSSFGIGGTNAHAILEEAPAAEPPRPPTRRGQLLVLSARTETALEAATDNLARWLGENPEADLADVAYTLQVGRQAFEHRRTVVCEGIGEAAAVLADRSPERVLTRFQEPVRRPVVFLFPGQGAQSLDMGRGVYETEPVFRGEVDACAELLRVPLGRDLRDILYPSPERREEAARELRETRFAQPALFVVEYALAQLWRSWGLEPWAMIGHSIGEYVAACLAGVLSLRDALTLVAARGALMGRMPPGAMLSTGLAEDELAPLLAEEGLSLAAVNGPAFTVASGPEDAIARLDARLPADVRRRRLHTSHAFHSGMMEPVLGQFAELVGRVLLQPPTLPYLSNLTGDWITVGEATDPEYWARHLRQPVRFAAGLERLLAAPGGQAAVLLEVGPGVALASLARQQVQPAARSLVVASMGGPRNRDGGAATLLQTLGRLWLTGVEVDWSGVHVGERRRRLTLPTYPFQRRRFWIEPRQPLSVPGRDAATGLDTPAPAATTVPGHERPEIASAYVPPRGETERRLAEIWQRLLGIERVGVHDDFFELGGHSLLATQVLSRVREELGAEISLDVFFAAGTVAGLARAVEDSPRTGDGLQAPPIRPRPRDGATPLSFAQQRLWFLDQLAPGSNAYNMAAPLRLTGQLDRAALSRALDEVVRRHEALRTTFGSSDGEPFQVFAPAAPQAFPLVDLSALPAAAREAELRKAVLGPAALPFDLERGPLLRTLLVRSGDDEHAMLVTIHHIVSDGWSMGIFITELATLYAAFSAGRPSPLPELAVQYADFAVWQREWLQGKALERQLAFWRNLMAAAPAALELPTDRPRPAVQTFNGAIRTLALPDGIAAAVRAMGQARGATPFMVLLAAFKTLLGRSTSQTDIVTGTPVANRTRSEVEGLIGFFANTLLTRTDLSGDPPFQELLQRVQITTLGAFIHQDLPFERLVEELRPQRDVSRQPLFQVMFALQNVPSSVVEVPGLRLNPIELGEPAEHFDLTLFIHEVDGVFQPALRYNTDLFDGSTALRLLEHFRNLVEAVVADPGRTLSRLPLLSAAERHHLLHGWNDAGPARDRDRLVHELFREQARRTPDSTALIGEDERLTYRELDERSDRLARGLAALGIGAETLVGICLPRRPEMVVTILAVLKAGGAYLPLDPAYPRERIAYMLRQGGARFLLSSRELATDLPEHGARAVCLDAESLPDEPAEPLSLAADQAAYVIFTSGSTGRPKGAVLTHANLCSYVAALGERLRIGENDVYLHTASFSFSSSVRQMMLPLCRGAALVLASQEQIGNPLHLLELIRRSHVTVADLVPSYWRSCLHALEESEAGHRREVLDNDLRLLVAASERLLSDVPDGWRRLGHGARLVNMLGQTETTGIVSVYPLPSPRGEGIRTVPVGRPIAGTALYLLDSAMEPVPLGGAGEVFIGGAGVGRGYLGQPDLTAEHFVPDPWSGEPGARFYRTGDLARLLPDGNLEFIGRKDHQIKLRGFRIEAGEIEAALNRHPAVREAVVLARDADSAEKLLVAYFVPAFVPAGEPASVAAADLRGFLQGILPDYMVPGVYVPLSALPLTPTGKVDRGALPDIDPGRSRQAAGRVPPRTEKEGVLAGIWAQVLRLEEVGVEDDFFELGGHSLLAAQVISRIRKSFQTEVPVRMLFEKPTVAALAAALPDTAPASGQVRTVRRVARSSQVRQGSTHQLSDAEVENLLVEALEKKRKAL